MGIWIEYHCENRLNKSAEGLPRVGHRCLSHDDAGPMDMAADTSASLAQALRLLDEEALSNGWKKTSNGWICPYCLAQLSQK